MTMDTCREAPMTIVGTFSRLLPANNWTFSERSENVLSWFIERFVKTFFGRIFVEGFGRP